MKLNLFVIMCDRLCPQAGQCGAKYDAKNVLGVGTALAHYLLSYRRSC
jgi:hypothetical protein